MKTKICISVYENDKKIGYFNYKRRGTEAKSVCIGKIVKNRSSAIRFSNEKSFYKTIDIFRRCFPNESISFDIEDV